MNRDTLYSFGVFDLTQPVTIVVPDTGKRFLSMVMINEDHYIKQVAYAPGDYVLTREKIGTRYVQVVFRTFVDPEALREVEGHCQTFRPTRVAGDQGLSIIFL